LSSQEEVLAQEYAEKTGASYQEVLKTIRTVPGAKKAIAKFLGEKLEEPKPQPQPKTETEPITVTVSSTGTPAYYGPSKAVKQAFKSGKLGEAIKQVQKKTGKATIQYTVGLQRGKPVVTYGIIKPTGKTIVAYEKKVAPQKELKTFLIGFQEPKLTIQGKSVILTYKEKNEQDVAKQVGEIKNVAKQVDSPIQKKKETETYIRPPDLLISENLKETEKNLEETTKTVVGEEPETKSFFEQLGEGFTGYFRSFIPSKVEVSLGEEPPTQPPLHMTRTRLYVQPKGEPPKLNIEFPHVPTLTGELFRGVPPLGLRALRLIEGKPPAGMTPTMKWMLEKAPGYAVGSALAEATFFLALWKGPNLIGKVLGRLRKVEPIEKTLVSTSRWTQRSYETFEVGWGKPKPSTLTYEFRGGDFPSRYMVDLGYGGYGGGSVGTLTQQITYLEKPPTLAKLKLKHLWEDLEKGVAPIHVHVPAEITKGKYGDYDTFIGFEAAEYLKTYLEVRKLGTIKIPPENLTPESSVIRDETRKEIKHISEKQIRMTVHNLYLKAGLIQAGPWRLHPLRTHSLRKFFRTQLVSRGIPTDYVEYRMGHKTSTYMDVKSKGIEFMRNLYASANLTIRSSTKTSKLEILKTIVRSLGMDPEKVLVREALTQPHRTIITQEDQIKILNKTLKELLRHEILGEGKNVV